MKRCLLVMLFLGAVMFIQPSGSVAQDKHSLTVLRIKIEAPELDKRILLDKLAEHAETNHLRFEPVDQDFDYRIVFLTGQQPVATVYGELNASMASADVYDSEGNELFKFDRKGRGSDKGATNAVAKEIIKRLLEWRSLSHQKAA